MLDYFALMRAITAKRAKDGHGIEVHSPYECDDEGCRICQDFFLDEQIDRTHDEGKERTCLARS